MLERVLSILEAELGPTYPDLASTLHDLAFVMQGQGELDAARALYQRALSIKEAAPDCCTNKGSTSRPRTS